MIRPAAGCGSSTLLTTISTCWITRPSATSWRKTKQCWRTARGEVWIKMNCFQKMIVSIYRRFYLIQC
nr:MAG TPA: hypothetical protein [Caudoviricetes sp.]